MNNVKKFAFYLKKSGFRQTFQLVCSYLWGKLRMLLFRGGAKLFWHTKAAALADKLENQTVMVFTPSVEWNFLFQRAQQMASCYARQEHISVLFLTTQRHYDNFFAVKEIADGIFLVNDHLSNRIDQVTQKSRQVVSCIYNISSVDLLNNYHSDKIEYEYVDDLSVTVSQAESLQHKLQIHQQLLEKADLTVATAQKLFEEALPISKNVILSPNAADYAFFSQKVEPNAKLRDIRKQYDCVLEYYGALASWFDYDLVRSVAERNPNWVWVLIGKKIDNDMERARIETLPNVVYIPAVPYSELPSYIAGADILTIPFVLNNITESTSPVKLFEYMASKKPIITSDMNECRKYASVHIYHDVDSFERLVQRSLEEQHDPGYLSLLEREAQDNTWNSRALQILQALQISD